ncbi:MAG: hypothetical protein F6K42_26035 [Leptolyngbya sp. SIO1D8]|nr:hypothetical protein [Leptolyngbya sp. SIO1D8]
MAVSETPRHPPEVIEISLETQTLVEQTIPCASDEVKRKTMELMEIIKWQSQANLEATKDNDMLR